MDRRRAKQAARVSRREMLRLGAAFPLTLLGPTGLALAGCESPASKASLIAKTPTRPLAPHPDWLRTARIAGFEAYEEQPDDDLARRLDLLAAQGVTVVEADSDLSTYLTEEVFERQVAFFDRIAEASQSRGMRCVAYYPMLEVLSPNAVLSPHTVVKQHPDWVQLCMDGRLNSFIGGGGRVFWVEPGEESAWMCPTSGYVDYFSERVNRLATTRLDGLWGDVPLLSDIGGIWPCVNATCAAKFKNETGRDIPKKVDWDDETFRLWVHHRHKVIWDFEQEVARRAKAVRADFELIVETVTMDYNGGTIQGLDGAFKDAGGVYRVWEVDAASDGTSMRYASADDWISMAAMMRHGASVTRPLPSWIFTYGLKEDDAELVMSLAIATGNCPYETKIPLMCDNVDPAYRTRMFQWIEQHGWLNDAEPQNPAAILFSTPSRDYLDRNAGVGLYCSLLRTDALWWTIEEREAAPGLDYMGDYRGAHKLLIHSHVPFDVLPTSRFDGTTVARYKFLFLPSAVALSDEHVAILKTYVEGGGTVLVTGADGGTYKETGEQRAKPLLNETFTLTASGAAAFVSKSMASGTVVHASRRAGQEYMRSGAPDVRSATVAAVQKAGVALDTDAPLAVVFDLRRARDGRLALMAVNLDGLGAAGAGEFTPKRASFDVRVPLGDKVPTRVTVSTSESAEPVSVPLQHDPIARTVSVHLDFRALALVTVE